MDTILKIDGNRILIGRHDGSVLNVSMKNLDFMPRAGDVVRIYESDDEIFVRKIDDRYSYGNESHDSDFTFRSAPIYDATRGYVDEAPRGTVNKWIYVVLALLFGWIGLHKFYSKKILKGVLYILFSWTFIPAVISIVEAIIAIIKTPDEYGNIIM